MKNMLRTTAVAGAGLLAVTLALTTDGARVAAQGMKPILVQVMNTAAEPVPVVSPVDRVLLQYPAVESDACLGSAVPVRRLLPDGTRVEAFAVPPGKMLVLTDLQGLVVKHANLGWLAGDIAFVHAAGMTSDGIRAYGPVSADAVSNEIVAVSVHLQTGGVIGPNVPVCLGAGILDDGGFRLARVQEARLHGYLIDE